MTGATEPMAALSVLAAAVAGWLLVRDPRPRAAAVRRPRLAAWVGIAVLTASVAARSRPTAVPVLLIVTAAIAGGSRLWRRHQTRVAADLVAGRVLESCRTIGAELAAGRPPGEALGLAAQEWPQLLPVADAAALGASVPDALRRLAAVPGAADLRILAGAWEVAHRSGQGLAVAVAAIEDELAADASTRRLVGSELASARATARVVAGLPVVALLMGSGAGGDPWRFLLGTPAGIACLAAGSALTLLGIGWIERIAAAVGRA